MGKRPRVTPIRPPGSRHNSAGRGDRMHGTTRARPTYRDVSNVRARTDMSRRRPARGLAALALLAGAGAAVPAMASSAVAAGSPASSSARVAPPSDGLQVHDGCLLYTSDAADEEDS